VDVSVKKQQRRANWDRVMAHYNTPSDERELIMQRVKSGEWPADEYFAWIERETLALDNQQKNS
jgi:hypothetical protein